MVLDRATGSVNPVTDSLDRPVQSFTWSHDSKLLFFTVLDRGRQSIQMIPAAGGATRVIVSGPVSADDMQFSGDGKTMIYSSQSGSAPTEIYRAASSGGAPVALTHLNDTLLAQYALTPLEEFWVDGADKTRVQSFVVKPPNFDPEPEISGSVSDSRRTGRRVGRKLELSLECAGDGGGRVCGGDAESARIQRLRPEIHRRHQGRLGRQSLRRHHGRRWITRRRCRTPTRIAWRRRADPTAAT